MKKIMKRLGCMLVLAALLMGCVGASLAEGTAITVNMKLKVAKPANTANNPEIPGENPLTGLPASGEAYTPILLVLDNAEGAYPHWGVSAADIMFQVPNQGSGNTKLMALFASEYPEYAGGSRSARMTMLPVANAFNSAMASGNYAPIKTSAVSVEEWLGTWGYKKAGKYYDLLGNRFKTRTNEVAEPHNLLGHIKEIHEDLIKKGASFEVRPFLFTDEPLSRGDAATRIDATFYPSKKKERSNPASNCVFDYTEGQGYTRTSVTGLNVDRTTGEALKFSNLIFLRVKTNAMDGYTYYTKNFVGGGQADIFMNGRHIQGAWYRENDMSRLILLDDEMNELELQRGKTFFVITTDYCDVSYT